MYQPIQVTYQSTSSPYVANQWLRSLPDLIACDTETAVKFTTEQLDAFRLELDTPISSSRRIQLNAALEATALSHPYYVDITHVQIAWSDHEAYVFILDNKRIHDLVLNFLVSTTHTQIWHNATFDFKHIYYHTHKFPPIYEDSQLLAKCILNHVDVTLATVGLKELAGKWYGQWAISPDSFTKDQMYSPDVLLYAATDSCATYKLWHSIKDYTNGVHIP